MQAGHGPRPRPPQIGRAGRSEPPPPIAARTSALPGAGMETPLQPPRECARAPPRCQERGCAGTSPPQAAVARRTRGHPARARTPAQAQLPTRARRARTPASSARACGRAAPAAARAQGAGACCPAYAAALRARARGRTAPGRPARGLDPSADPSGARHEERRRRPHALSVSAISFPEEEIRERERGKER